MNAFKKTAMASAIATASFISVPAMADREIIPKAQEVFWKLRNSDFRYEYNNIPMAMLRHTGTVQEFRDITTADTKYVYLGAQISRIGDPTYLQDECVSLVKALTSYQAQVRDWRPAEFSNGVKKRISQSYIPSFGTAIATFPDGENYSGHAAIFLRKEGNYIVVFDQNWLKDGRAAIHRIRFSGTGDVSDAGSYYVVN